MYKKRSAILLAENMVSLNLIFLGLLVLLSVFLSTRHQLKIANHQVTRTFQAVNILRGAQPTMDRPEQIYHNDSGIKIQWSDGDRVECYVF
ncbi:hypothetical protein FHQ08_06210 [Lactobacillus sp. CC-MHH1034]|uniref:hypothetical protein n=1 Tax=Agrilactobacillus fermenti TaxID=2586909 RepID=UPI001E606D66|nr:hypothetical protein [Agrilactobacillus fermenti]MCD2256311.1 hypothetical protein [Agrilactobacillus fermenti]